MRTDNAQNDEEMNAKEQLMDATESASTAKIKVSPMFAEMQPEHLSSREVNEQPQNRLSLVGSFRSPAATVLYDSLLLSSWNGSASVILVSKKSKQVLAAAQSAQEKSVSVLTEGTLQTVLAEEMSLRLETATKSIISRN